MSQPAPSHLKKLPSPRSWVCLAMLGVIGSLLGGCAAIQQDVEVKSDVLTASAAAGRSVAVVTSETGNFATATRLADLIRAEMGAQGFQIKEVPEQADLVVIGTFTRTSVQEDPAIATNRVAIESDPLRASSFSFGNPGMTQASSLSLVTDPTASTPKRKAGIIVTAFPRQSWLTARGDNTLRAWRVIAITTQYKRQEDILAKLVQACGPTFKSLVTAKQ